MGAQAKAPASIRRARGERGGNARSSRRAPADLSMSPRSNDRRPGLRRRVLLATLVSHSARLILPRLRPKSGVGLGATEPSEQLHKISERNWPVLLPPPSPAGPHEAPSQTAVARVGVLAVVGRRIARIAGREV